MKKQKLEKRVSMEEASIPIELLIEIFCKLPSKTLLRFKCISKLVRATITDPNFVTKHCEHWSVTNRSGYLIQHGSLCSRLSYLDSKFSVTNQNHLLQQLRSAGIPHLHYRINCSCDGLLCLSDAHYSSANLCLWNPSTGIVKQLPNTADLERYYVSSLLCGFGRASDDYKVLQILHIVNRDYDYNDVHNLCRYRSNVYSLRANEWRWIDFKFSPTFRFDEKFGTSCRDGFYCVASYKVNRNKKRRIVMSFSFRDEIFRQISLPPNICEQRGRVATGSINDSLALMVQYESVIDVWGLNEGGVGISPWNKLYKIDTGCGPSFFSFGLDGKVLMVKNVDKYHEELVFKTDGKAVMEKRVNKYYEQLLSWDFEKRELMEIGFGDYSIYSCFTYSESLLLAGEV